MSDNKTRRSAESSQSEDRLDLNLLQVFDAVMVERHVTRAAEQLDMTQSAVSNALKRLRAVLGDQLFVKAPRGVDPTPRALALWPSIHRGLQDITLAVRPQPFDPSRNEVRYRIAMVDLTASLLAPHLFPRLHEKAPSASLFFVPHAPAATGRLLMRGELDFAVIIDPPRASVLQSMPLWSDHFVVAARKNHPLLAKGKLALADFCAAPQLVVNEAGDSDAPDLIDDQLEQRGITRYVALTVNQFSVVTRILRSTDLLAVLPARFVNTPPASLELDSVALPIKVPDAVVHLCWHQRNLEAPAQAWLKQQLIEAAVALGLQSEQRSASSRNA